MFHTFYLLYIFINSRKYFQSRNIIIIIVQFKEVLGSHIFITCRSGKEKMPMKMIVLVVVGIVVMNSCSCVANNLEGDGTYKTVHGNKVRKLAKTDGRTSATGDAIDHVCPLGSYPCRSI